MTFDALRRLVEDTLAAVYEHAQNLDRIAAEQPDLPGAQTLLDRFGG